MDFSHTVINTQSLCPRCLKRIDAGIVLQDGRYYMVKNCPEHGSFRTVIWSGEVPLDKWILEKERAWIDRPRTPVVKGCPYDCGLCSEHRQHTCTALIEVTQRCNLHCRFCFADSGAGGGKDPTVEQIDRMYQSVIQTSGRCNVQISGGEPTLRSDLPQIVRSGKEMGFPFIQLNTNGIRLAVDEKFVGQLKDAGLDSVFLQFDGTEDSVYKTLRGCRLLAVKKKAIENCRKYGIGVVLVPTLVPDVNVQQIGDIIVFGLENIEAVRGVHFQPVSYFGRIPSPPEDKDRITLPDLMAEIEIQTGGKVRAGSLKPPRCENSLCSFHGSFLYRGDGKLVAIAADTGCCCKKAAEGAAKAKVFVAKNWSGRPRGNPRESSAGGGSGWDKILDCIHNRSFSISAMAFQDVWNVDLNRVRDCCIHVVSPEGKLIPFCLYNLTDMEGNPLYRNRSQWT